MTPQNDTKWTESEYIIRLVNKGKPYQVDEGTVNGKRRRVRFETLGKARQHCRELRADRQNYGKAAGGLSDRDRLDATEARKELGKTSIMEAVRFFLSHHTQSGDTLTIDALCREYIDAPGRRGGQAIARRPLSKVYVKRRLSPFQSKFGKLPVSGVTQDAVEKWIGRKEWTGTNKRHYLATVKALFEYARRKKYAAINPAADIELEANPDAASKAPEILSPAQVKALMGKAMKKTPELVPVLAVMFWAGLRPNEAVRLDWAAVHIAAESITVGAEVAKMRTQRHVEMTGNLRAWLMPYAAPRGPIWDKGTSTYWRQIWALEKASGVKLPYGAGRHAFASYHYALHGSQDKTAQQLGHADAGLLLTTYKNIHTKGGQAITKDLAGKYFNIRPEGKPEIMQIPLEAVG